MERKNAPSIKKIEAIPFVEPKCHEIAPGVNLYVMDSVQNETARFDLYFNAGKCTVKNGISSFTNGLLLSGTKSKNSIEINESINSLGGFHESGVSMENAAVTMYCLREYMGELFDITFDSITNVCFDKKEVDEYMADRKLRHKISLEKVNYLAQRAFQKMLFASDPFYSSIVEDEDFDTVTPEKLIAYHKQHYLQGLTKVVVVGNVKPELIEHIIKKCKTLVSPISIQTAQSINSLAGSTHVVKQDALQTAIRLGRILFNKKHEDYPDFLVLNTILGDYFGSRLMSNIREDKGYTYGIGSMLNEFENIGYFMIGTEVKSEVAEDTLTQIKYEIERLQTELVSEEELNLVRNYMLGQLLKSADGPYAMTDLYMSVEAQGKDLEFYNHMIQVINEISPNRIKELAIQYLQWDELTVVSTGS